MGGDNYQDGSGSIITFFLVFGGIPLAVMVAILALIASAH